MSSNPRIQKALAQVGIASRRKIEAQIVAGNVKVNGKVAVLGQCLEPGDRVEFAGEIINWQATDPVQLLLYNKPLGEVCTRDDPQRRAKVFDALPHLKTGRWVSVGRLDINTSGLLLFTNSGELADKLMHPRNSQVREYKLRVYGDINPALIDKLRTGVQLEDGPAKFDSIAITRAGSRNHWLVVTLHSGRNRLVRRLCAAVDLEVNRLIRTRYGSIVLSDDLAQGAWQIYSGDLKKLLS